MKKKELKLSITEKENLINDLNLKIKNLENIISNTSPESIKKLVDSARKIETGYDYEMKISYLNSQILDLTRNISDRIGQHAALMAEYKDIRNKLKNDPKDLNYDTKTPDKNIV